MAASVTKVEEFDRHDLIERVQREFPNESKELVENIVRATFKSLRKAVDEHHRVEIYETGTFRLSVKKGRKGEFKGKAYETSDSYTVKFRPATRFLEEVNKNRK